MGEGEPKLNTPALLAVVTAGFGGFLAHGGTALDEFTMRAGGANEREAKIRVGALAGFEHGVVAMIVCPPAIAALATAVAVPARTSRGRGPSSPPPAFVLEIWLAERYRVGCAATAGGGGQSPVFSTPSISCTRC